MDYKLLITVFITIFLAELGDKTQIATMLFATDKEMSKLTIFIGASLAIMLACLIGILAGSLISNNIDKKYLSYIAGISFIMIGIWTLITA